MSLLVLSHSDSLLEAWLFLYAYPPGLVELLELLEAGVADGNLGVDRVADRFGRLHGLRVVPDSIQYLRSAVTM